MIDRPPGVRPRDLSMACVIVMYAGWYSAAHHRLFKVIVGFGVSITVIGAALIGGLCAVVAVAIGMGIGVPGVAILFTMICAGILAWNLLLPHHHGWALPGGRAVCVIRRSTGLD